MSENKINQTHVYATLLHGCILNQFDGNNGNQFWRLVFPTSWQYVHNLHWASDSCDLILLFADNVFNKYAILK